VKNLIKFVSVLIMLFLVSCSTTKVVKQVRIPRAVPGTRIPIEDFQRVRYGENMKTFSLNRYVDPADPDIMYERTVMYRLEETPSWNLKPAKPFYHPTEEPIQYVDVSAKQRSAELELGLKAQKTLINTMDVLAKTSSQNFKTLMKVNATLHNKLITLQKDFIKFKKQKQSVKSDGKEEIPKAPAKKNQMEDMKNF
jgi:hypothetical protein